MAKSVKKTKHEEAPITPAPKETKKSKKKVVEAPQVVDEQLDEEVPPSKSVIELQEEGETLWDAISECEDKKQRRELISQYNEVAKKCNEQTGAATMAVIKSMGEAPKKEKQEAEPETNAKLLVEDEPVKVGDTLSIVFAGGKVTGKVTEVNGDVIKLTEGDGTKYAVEKKWILPEGFTPSELIAKNSGGKTKKEPSSLNPSRAPKAIRKVDKPPVEVSGELKVMKRTPEIMAVLEEGISGADKIRKVYDMVTGWSESTKKAKTPAAWDTEDFVKMSGINRSRVKGCLEKFRP